MITAQEAQAQAILSQARVSIIGKYELATAATASWLVVIVDDVTADRSSEMNTEMYRAKASAQTKYDPKYPAKAVQQFL